MMYNCISLYQFGRENTIGKRGLKISKNKLMRDSAARLSNINITKRGSFGSLFDFPVDDKHFSC